MGTLAALKKRYHGKLIRLATSAFAHAVDNGNYQIAARIAVLAGITHAPLSKLLGILRTASRTYERMYPSFYKGSPPNH